MILFPAIDIYRKRAVRLLRGSYGDMTDYGDPAEIAKIFAASGMTHIHTVDLEGARDGNTPNMETVLAVKAESGCFVETGGGIRTAETAAKYLDAGIDRVILGTAAVKDPQLAFSLIREYGEERIAVGVDIRDGMAAVSGWTETSGISASSLCAELSAGGVKYLIVTDISRDGAMTGANHAMYSQLSKALDVCITASGGVSSVDDLIRLNKAGLYGAIIGKAYYTGAVKLEEAAEAISR